MVVNGFPEVSISYMGRLYAYIKNDKSLWAWGHNSHGQLGDGTKIARHKPIKVMDQIIRVTTSFFHSAAVNSDGSLWVWGDNTWGQLGEKTVKERLFPKKIMDEIMMPQTATATATSSTVLVNGENKTFDAYNIGGNNYFKLRDLAYVLSGTEKQFEVGWDSEKNAISLTSGQLYTTVGGEMAGKGTGSKTANPMTSKIYLDGKEAQFAAYNIEGSNYFKLRDIGEAFDFGVDWDAATQTIRITTSKGYGEADATDTPKKYEQ